jgi:hypothetical protein
MIVKHGYWLLFFVILKFVLQYYVNGNDHYELHRDEFLHLDQAKHLDWGYHSVPPFTSWISRIILQLGNSVFWIKFFPAMFGAMTIIVVWRIVEDLNGTLYAGTLAAIGLIFSSLLRLNMLFQPNSSDIFFWTLLLYSVFKFIQTTNPGWIYLSAISFAIGFLNKYNIVFCLAGLMPAVLFSPYSTMYRSKHFYIAALLALILITPNLLWQYHHNFPVITHMRELHETQLRKIPRIDFLREQIYLFSGGLLLIGAALISIFTISVFRKYKLLAYSFGLTLLMFFLLRAKGYYAYGLYPILFAFGAVYWERLFSNRKAWLRPLPFIFILIMFIPLYNSALPIKKPEAFFDITRFNKLNSKYTWEDGKEHLIPQDFADMLSWKELADKVEAVYATLPDKNGTLIIADNYGQAGAINYYSGMETDAVSFNADYINWFELKKPIKSVVYVITKGDRMPTKFLFLFQHLDYKAEIKNKYAREYGTKIYVLSDPKKDLRPILQMQLTQLGAVYR